MRRKRYAGGLGIGLAMTVLTAGFPSAAEWRTVECVPADLPPEALFEVVEPIDGFEAEPVAWAAARSDQNARAAIVRDTGERHGGGAALAVDYEFVGKPEYEYVEVDGKAPIAKPGLGLGLWIRHDGTPFALRVRFVDAGGETHQSDMILAERPGWQFSAGLFDSPAVSWGGDGNNRVDYPCRLQGFCIDRPQRGFKGRGRLWIDDVALVRPRKTGGALAVEARDARFGNIYTIGETAVLRARGDGERIAWSVRDLWGREVAAGKGPASGVDARFELARQGFFACDFRLMTGGNVVAAQSYRCAALPAGDPPPSDFVGVCTHFGQGHYPLECMELMRRYGLDQYRDEVSWRGYETAKGRLVMPEFAAAYLKHSAAVGMRPLIIFNYNNPHYDNDGFPNSPEAIAGFAAYAADLARKTQGQVAMFEVWNEWVGGCGMSGRPGRHDGEAYGRLLGPTYAAVKKARPDATVVGIGGEYGPKCADSIVAAVGIAGPDAMDAWSIHPYRYPRSPEESDLLGEVGRIADRVSAAGVKSKAWITEIGYPTHRTSGGSDEAKQARLCVRTLALLEGSGLVEKVFWYDLKDDGLSPDYNEHNFGLVRHHKFGCAPKPAIVAMSVFIRMTAGFEPKGLVQNGSVYSAAYRRADGRELLILWSTAPEARVSLAGTIEEVYDLMGNRVPVEQAAAVGPDPVYVTGRGLKLGPKP